MLSTVQKAEILMRAGMTVPTMPPASPNGGEIPPRWRQQVDNLYAGYVAARAARSLRKAEEMRTLAVLRRANARMSDANHMDDHDED